MRFVISFILILFSVVSLQAEKTVGIFTWGSVPWDPDSTKTGITGSEEAVIYISQELVNLGYRVTVLGNPPEYSLHSIPDANPRYVHTSNCDDQFDIAISWRSPQNARYLKTRAEHVYLWPHDSCFETVADEDINGFDDVLWLSKWQRGQWVSLNPGFAKFTNIFGNGINPDQFNSITEKENPYSCIYGSNYAWGLEHLLDIWPIVKKEFPRATLDIYYGWQHWGFLSPTQERKMRQQIKSYASLGVQEHGLVGHEEITRAYERASFWTYPCQVSETFCITALRAQLAGCIPVVINTAALKETVLNGYTCVSQETYLDTLLSAMDRAEDISLSERKSASAVILQKYTWRRVAEKWHSLFAQHNGDSLKLLVLIIASDAHPAYIELQNIWRSYMHHDRAHIDAYFIKSDPNLTDPIEVVGDTIYAKGEECYKPCILKKTLQTMEYASKNMSKYDYVLRTNLSSFYVYPRLLEYLKTLPRKNCYAAHALIPAWDVPPPYSGVPFGSGSGFILSSDLVKKLVSHQQEVLKNSANIPDDVLIGDFLHKNSIPVIHTPWHAFSSLDDWLSQKDSLSTEAFQFRAKGLPTDRKQEDPYAEELYVLSELCNMFYP
ncbi:MAG: hypothetical protein JSR46_11475 [Verrucomicrobia bacterium]|nr:hypothetical protein [Verrucomicrobiota bacterium]